MLVIGTKLPGKRWREEELPSEDYVRNAMPRKLGTFDMTMIFLMVMFFINNAVGTTGAGAAAFTYWIIGAFAFFLPCIIATAQLGTMFSHEVSFWVPGILGMVGSAGIAVTLLQGLNRNWLAEPRVQGVFIVFILILSAILSLQRFRVVQIIVNMTTVLMLCVIALLGVAALIWLATGHHAATSITRASDLAIQPGNYVLFSTVILAFLGANVSMTLGSEITDFKVVSRHLFRGGLLVLVSN